MGKLLKPPFIGEKGEDWGFPEEFGDVRIWQTNYRGRQHIRLFDTTKHLILSGQSSGVRDLSNSRNRLGQLEFCSK